jgi:hypothetical protein
MQYLFCIFQCKTGKLLEQNSFSFSFGKKY